VAVAEELIIKLDRLVVQVAVVQVRAERRALGEAEPQGKDMLVAQDIVGMAAVAVVLLMRGKILQYPLLLEQGQAVTALLLLYLVVL
jgi:hypothetical protein